MCLEIKVWLFPAPYQCTTSGPLPAESRSYRCRLGQSWCGGTRGNSPHCWLHSCSQSPSLSLEKAAWLRILWDTSAHTTGLSLPPVLSPHQLLALHPCWKRGSAVGKDGNSSAQRPLLGWEVGYKKKPLDLTQPLRDRVVEQALDNLWDEQAADETAPIPAKQQCVLPTKSWLSLRAELLWCQGEMGAAEHS